ncbi:MAG: hydroxyquinol 1,2-dioxygenase [Chloroflexota bacterium]|nr:hydroxyquinol 1,2-dioxygenase [Chloroflexota bacterium]
MATTYVTKFGSLEHYEKGGVEVIQDDAKNYVFSNMFDVASKSKPYEKVCVGRNQEYSLEVLRAEGTSGWRTPAHDEFALVMDGEVEVRLVKLDHPTTPTEGSVAVPGEPRGKKMGHIKARKGHMSLLPVGAAYQFHADRPSVILLQTTAGQDTMYRWAEICQTA